MAGEWQIAELIEFLPQVLVHRFPVNAFCKMDCRKRFARLRLGATTVFQLFHHTQPALHFGMMLFLLSDGGRAWAKLSKFSIFTPLVSPVVHISDVAIYFDRARSDSPDSISWQHSWYRVVPHDVVCDIAPRKPGHPHANASDGPIF